MNSRVSSPGNTDSLLMFRFLFLRFLCVYFVFDQLDLKFQCLGVFFFFFFPRNLIQVDIDHFNHLLDMKVSINFEFKFLFDCLLL